MDGSGGTRLVEEVQADALVVDGAVDFNDSTNRVADQRDAVSLVYGTGAI